MDKRKPYVVVCWVFLIFLLVSCGGRKKLTLQEEQKIQVVGTEQIRSESVVSWLTAQQNQSIQWNIKSVDNQPFTIETQRTEQGEKIIFTGGEILINQTQESQTTQGIEQQTEQKLHHQEQELEQTKSKKSTEKQQSRSWFLVLVFALISFYVGYKIKS